MKLKFYPETHCDECNEVVHNHFDCPVCEVDHASTSIYGFIHEMITDVRDIFECLECGAEFILVSGTAYHGEWEWYHNELEKYYE